MRFTIRIRRGINRLIKGLAGAEGSEIIEFAVSLPLLLVMVVAIYDFGSAFVLKEKIGIIAREGARFASNLPSTDLLPTGTSCATVASICSVRDAVDAALVANKLNDCALAAAVPQLGNPVSASAPLSWYFKTTSRTNGCPNDLILIVDRGAFYTTTLTINPTNPTYTIEATKLTLTYPYSWTFNRVITLIASGTNYLGTSELTEAATMQDLN
ncbi:MAG TPA: TadE family protein [Terriglobales bacterium]|nr:TadE family protein [Terriglobales bacterium]